LNDFRVDYRLLTFERGQDVPQPYRGADQDKHENRDPQDAKQAAPYGVVHSELPFFAAR
jgi:hypothetical protein